MKEAGEIHQENVWPQRELEHGNRRERKDTKSLTGQRKEKLSKTSPVPAESLATAGPADECP